MPKQKKYTVTGEGICHNCGGKTQKREHVALTDRQVRAPFYYSKWFYCYNPNCKTTTIMHDEDRVLNNNSASRQFKDYQEDQLTLDFIRNIK